MGLGYETVNLALHSQMLWYFTFILIFIKIFATSITLGSGGSGGIFTPSLFMGAMTGYFFGSFVHASFRQLPGHQTHTPSLQWEVWLQVQQELLLLQ